MSIAPGDFHPAGLDRVRAVADAVLYEGYLLYPYRATSRKNQLRWQFGVLGPQGADAAGIGEDPHLSMQCLIDLGLLDLGSIDLGLLDIGRNESIENAQASLTIHVRFLQLQQRRPSGPTIAGDTYQSQSCGWTVSDGSAGTRRSRWSSVAPFR